MAGSKLIINTNAKESFEAHLAALFSGAVACDLAVSFVQLSGWQILRPYIAKLAPQTVRLVFTDWLGISHPQALRDALNAKIQIHNYNGSAVYHPKVYIVYGAHRKALRALVGSANLSGPALTSSIEAGILTDEAAILRQIKTWFDTLFERQSKALDSAMLDSIQQAWNIAAKHRLASQLAIGQAKRALKLTLATKPKPEPEEADVVEDAFSTVRAPIAVLGFDHAGNNVRNLSHALEIVNRQSRTSKQLSELHLVGLLDQKTNDLTATGRAMQLAATEDAAAQAWCQWINDTPEHELASLTTRLVSFKHAAIRFWRLREDVQNYFFINLNKGTDRRVLQTIEVLCNGSEIVEPLTVDDFRSLSSALDNTSLIPAFLRQKVEEYLDNKGRRTWNSDDRRIVLNAWRNVTGV